MQNRYCFICGVSLLSLCLSVMEVSAEQSRKVSEIEFGLPDIEAVFVGPCTKSTLGQICPERVQAELERFFDVSDDNKVAKRK